LENTASISKRTLDVLGCGTGRESDYTDKSEVYGVNFTIKSLRMAHEKHEKVNCVLATQQMLPSRMEATLDLGLTSFVLQHIPHEDIEIVVSNIKPAYRAVMLVEGIGIEESSYQFDHDYLTLFMPRVIERKRLAEIISCIHFFFFKRRKGK